MAIWVLFALMTGAAVLAVLWPLSRRETLSDDRLDERSLFRDQVAEIERDAARGLFTAEEKEAAIAEAGRRLLRSLRGARTASDVEGEPALRRRRAASAIALSTVPLFALTLYGALGSPHLPAEPLAARLETDPRRLDLAEAVARVEAHLAKSPEDGRGWEVIAPVYLRSGRLDDAVKAYASALRLLGETPARLSDYGEAETAAESGVVSAKARAAFERAVALDPTNAKARFYLALAAEQDGDKAAALARYQALLADAPADAPWLGAVRQRMAALQGLDAAATMAALPPAQRQEAIRGMVEGLAARLDQDGSDIEGWLRLVRAYTVLGEGDKARAALAKAKTRFSGNDEAGQKLAGLARELGLETDRAGVSP